MLPAAIPVIALLIGMGRPAASANETGANFRLEEHHVEFHNQDVKLAGSLLLPKSEVPVPAVVFVHGAGRQTREPYREVGEYFASHGIAALIYDKRGTGQSGGAYIVVGADVADGKMFYYRDNLFRRYGLSDTLRDVAEKAHLLQQDLHQTLQDGFRLSSFAPRSYPPPDKYVHPAWSHVNQPVLTMWGELDQHVLVGESVAGLKNSLAHANNENWTIIILPRTNHDLKISETGALTSKSYGYPAVALKTMTDWAWSAIDHRRSTKCNRRASSGKQEFFPIWHDTKVCDGMATEQSRQHYGFSSSSALLPTRSQVSGAI
jgi:pimeloyl-ACP methyl ester carboxylesterase